MAATLRLNFGEFVRSSDSSIKMSLSGETASSDSGTNMRRPADSHVSRQRAFQFIPKDLAAKCRKLIESYHAMYGFVGLPDMLWLSDARDVIECHEELTQLFKKASRSRGAKRANDSFLLIATTIVSLEVLARDLRQLGQAVSSGEARGKEGCSATFRPEAHVADGSVSVSADSASVANLQTCLRRLSDLQT